MKTKNRNPATLLHGKEVNPIIQFYFEFNHLKQLFRQGWLLRGISEKRCESVADHLFSTSILTLIIAENYYPQLDFTKLLKMTLVHELGEIYVGDITPKDYIPKDMKYQWELKALVEIFSKFPNGNSYISLWKEYEEENTPEAKFLRQIDILEAAFQSVVYRLQYKNDKVDDFLPWTQKRLKDKFLINLIKELVTLKDSFNQK